MSSTDSRVKVFVNWVDRRVLLRDGSVLHFRMHDSHMGREQFHEALKSEGFTYCPVCKVELSEEEGRGGWFEF